MQPVDAFLHWRNMLDLGLLFQVEFPEMWGQLWKWAASHSGKVQDPLCWQPAMETDNWFLTMMDLLGSGIKKWGVPFLSLSSISGEDFSVLFGVPSLTLIDISSSIYTFLTICCVPMYIYGGGKCCQVVACLWEPHRVFKATGIQRCCEELRHP